MGIIGALLEAIPTYTGLSPATFFTGLALLLAIYYLLASLTSPREPPYVPRELPPPPQPIQLGDVTVEELKTYDGTDPDKPLLMAIKGQIYDVSMSRGFYGPGGPYALFAGKDASRALAKMSFEEQDLTGDIEGLSAYELDALTDWEFKFMSKYIKVGQIVKERANGESHVKEVPVLDEHAREVSVSNGHMGDVPVSDGGADEHEKEASVSEDQAEEVPVSDGGSDEHAKEVPVSKEQAEEVTVSDEGPKGTAVQDEDKTE